MTSESQERMLAIVDPEDLDEVLGHLRALGGAAPRSIGRVTDAGRVRRLRGSSTASTARCWPTCPRTVAPRRRAAATTGRSPPPPTSTPPRRPPAAGAARRAATAGDVRSAMLVRHVVGLVAVRPPAVPQHGRRARAATPPCCASSTRRPAPTPAGAWRSPPTATTAGARSTRGPAPRSIVAEAVLNLACVGARPLAVVNCLNFGNPEHPEVMWQLSEAIDGMGDACRAFGLPVIGGNVSLYNESTGADIDPTPVVGLLGMVDRLDRRPPGVGLVDGDAPAPRRVRRRSAPGGLAGSAWAWRRTARAASCPPSTSPATARSPTLVRALVIDGAVDRRPRRGRRGPGPGAGRDGGGPGPPGSPWLPPMGSTRWSGFRRSPVAGRDGRCARSDPAPRGHASTTAMSRWPRSATAGGSELTVDGAARPRAGRCGGGVAGPAPGRAWATARLRAEPGGPGEAAKGNNSSEGEGLPYVDHGDGSSGSVRRAGVGSSRTRLDELDDDEYADGAPAMPLRPGDGRSHRERARRASAALSIRIDGLVGATNSLRSALAEQIEEYTDAVSGVVRAQSQEVDDYRRANERVVAELRRGALGAEDVHPRLSARLDELGADIAAVTQAGCAASEPRPAKWRRPPRSSCSW